MTKSERNRCARCSKKRNEQGKSEDNEEETKAHLHLGASSTGVEEEKGKGKKRNRRKEKGSETRGDAHNIFAGDNPSAQGFGS
ncbi:hypothetical protein [Candidatus Hakubella thermalkaliphila]|uniref:hypothetical protein n=1 Tax=Candidatus Hakubella thermalkaliphila TaxID=2754717 RepID=UPI00159344E6|nr:hypothetical protein [Candidatus Hakubella thermalkaliphila]